MNTQRTEGLKRCARFLDRTPSQRDSQMNKTCRGSQTTESTGLPPAVRVLEVCRKVTRLHEVRGRDIGKSNMVKSII